MDNIHKQNRNFSREMETIKKRHMDDARNLKFLKKCVTKVKNAFHRPISKLNTVRKASRNLKIGRDTIQTEIEREKRVK